MATEAPPLGPSPPKSWIAVFRTWEYWRRTLLAVAVSATGVTGWFAGWWAKIQSDTILAQGFLDGLQCAGSLVAVVAIELRFRTSSLKKPVVKELKVSWLGLWISWFVLYLAFVVVDVARAADDEFQYPWYALAAANLFNNFQSLFLLRLSEILSPRRERLPFVGALLLIAVFTCADFVSGYHHRESPNLPVELAFGAVSGVLAAIALGLFTGRLGSPYLKTSALVLVCLYLYTAIQPLFPIFRIESMFNTADGQSVATIRSWLQTVQTILKVLAAGLKVAVFLCIDRALSSERMLFFLEKSKEVRSTVDSDWKKWRAARAAAPSDRAA